MNKHLLSIILLISANLTFAGQLNDSANIFGPQGVKVAEHIKTLPVWIETQITTPREGLKEFADTKIKTLTDHGFIAVITTQPRAWRISMHPQGLVSSESTRLAGEKMTKEFKKGNFVQGAIGLADALNDLTQERSGINPIWIVIFIILGFIIVVFIIFGFFLKKSKPPLSKTKIDIITKKSTVNTEETQKANTLFSKYTLNERRDMAYEYRDNPRYSSSILDDPIMFYLFMNSMNHSCCNEVVYVQPAPVYYAPAPVVIAKTRLEKEESSYSPSISSSDSYGSSSSSNDSSYSSSDFSSSSNSNSSSDSSGADGSW